MTGKTIILTEIENTSLLVDCCLVYGHTITLCHNSEVESYVNFRKRKISVSNSFYQYEVSKDNNNANQFVVLKVSIHFEHFQSKT